MKKTRHTLWIAWLLLALAACAPGGQEAAPSSTPPPATPTPEGEAETIACDAVIAQALAAIDTVCAGTGRNQACYGHDCVTATLRGGASGELDSPGDLIELTALSRLDTYPYDPEGDLWGIALLRLQADLPETLPGQALTLVAYGETTLEDASADVEGAAPMQAIYLNTGLGEPACEDAPPPGVLIQNEAEEVASLTVNGVELAIGSTVFVQAQPNRDMVLAVLEGQVDALALGQRTVIVAGSQARMALGGPNGLRARDIPRLEPLDLRPLQRLPLPALPLLRGITLPSPLGEAELRSTRQPLLEVTRPALNITPPAIGITPPGAQRDGRERSDTTPER